MWLSSLDEFDLVAFFDETKGRLERISRRDLGDKAPPLYSADGLFSDHSNGTFILYRVCDSIVFRVLAPGVDKQFELDKATEVEVSGPPERRELTVVRNGVAVFKTIYSVREVYRPADDPTPFVDDEHFDFGLLASNISKNPERKDIFLGRDE